MTPSPAPRLATPKYEGIQVLRGLAAALVVLHHGTQAWSGSLHAANSAGWSNGAAGVDIFFVMSGFVMCSSLGERAQAPHPARDFLKRRLLRLVPLYWVVTLLYVLNLVRAAHHIPSLKSTPILLNLTPLHLFCSLCLIPFFNSFGTVQPILPVGWTLCFEMFFYLLLAFALATRLKPVLFLSLTMLSLVLAGFFRQSSWPAITTLCSPLLLEFLAGFLLGRAAATGSWVKLRLAAPCGLLALALMLLMPFSLASPLRVLFWGTEATLIVWAAVSLEPTLHQWWPRWAIFSGEASYSLYLVHLPLISALSRHSASWHLGFPAFLLLSVVLSFALAAAVHLLVEKPLTAMLKTTFFPRSKSLPSPTRQSLTPQNLDPHQSPAPQTTLDSTQSRTSKPSGATMPPPKPPAISVAMCTWNGGRYLPAQLESILTQRLPVSELVACDDGSSDETLQLLQDFAARAPFPVRIVQNRINLGSSKNFEQAISLCTGDLIALADQDDLWFPDKTATLVAELQQSASAAGIFSNAVLMDEHSVPGASTLWDQFGFSRAERQRLAAGQVAPVLLRRPVVTGATLLFRSDLRQHLLPIPTGWVHDEWIAWRLALHGGLIFTEADVMAYRTHASQQIGVPQSWSARARNAWRAVRHGPDPATRARITREYLHGARELARLTAEPDSTANHALFELEIQAKIAFCKAALSALQQQRLPRVWFALTNISRYRRFRFLPMYSLLRDILM